ncbi:primosomal protein N' [bacterium]|nr:primosomal protein N' [bacterium]
MNNKLSIAKVSVPLPIDKSFDYYIPSRLSNRIQKGLRVSIMFNHKSTIGYVIGRSFRSKIKTLNPILDVVDKYPVLSTNSIRLAKHIKDYYVCTLGEAFEAMLPNNLRKSKGISANLFSVVNSTKKMKKNKLIYTQNLSDNSTYAHFREEVNKRLTDKKRVIFLVPEKPMINRIKEYFVNIKGIKIAVWHGGLSRKEMLKLWNDLANDDIDLIIGTRSCIFAPIKNLGLVIIECENDYAYKNDQTPYYNSVNVAYMRCEIEKCDLILSSAVPSAGTYRLVSKRKIGNKKVDKINDFAPIELLPLNHGDKIDFMIEKQIEYALGKKEKILICLNRKGFATYIYCKKCKETLKCDRCSRNLRFNYSQKKLICPYCGFNTEMVEICPKCRSTYVKYGGLGVEKLESNLKRNFPAAKIITLDELLKNKKGNSYDILITTKKVINYEEFKPEVTIVWNLDSMLNFADFRSCEEAYQVLSKLLLMTKNKIIICTSLKDDFYLLKGLKNLNFIQFYKNELKSRKELNLPPFYHFGLVSMRSFNKKSTEAISSKLYACINKLKSGDLELSKFDSPQKYRLREKYYKYLLVKSKNIELLSNVLKKGLKKIKGRRVIITVNVDPI